MSRCVLLLIAQRRDNKSIRTGNRTNLARVVHGPRQEAPAASNYDCPEHYREPVKQTSIISARSCVFAEPEGC